MSTPDANKAIDIMVSRIYETGDATHPLQRVLYGVEVVDGIPVPIAERRDANNGALIQSYFGNDEIIEDIDEIRRGLDSIGTVFVGSTAPTDERVDIWIDTSS